MKLTKNNVLEFPTLEEIIREGLGLDEKDDWVECFNPYEDIRKLKDVMHKFTPETIVEFTGFISDWAFGDSDLSERKQETNFIYMCSYAEQVIDWMNEKFPFGSAIIRELLHNAIQKKSGSVTESDEVDPLGYVKISMGNLYFQRNYEIERVFFKVAKNIDQRILNTLLHERGAVEFSDLFTTTSIKGIYTELKERFLVDVSHVHHSLAMLSNDTIKELFQKGMFETDVSELSVKEQLNKAEYPILYTLIMRNE